MKSDVEIAKEVMQGKWGTGAERKRRLEQAGYDYNAIQSYVNTMIKTGKPIKEVTIDARDVSGVVVYLEV